MVTHRVTLAAAGGGVPGGYARAHQEQGRSCRGASASQSKGIHSQSISVFHKQWEKCGEKKDDFMVKREEEDDISMDDEE